MTTKTESPASTYVKKDFMADQEVRWCPGCGDYAILSSVQNVFAGLGLPKEKFVVISGIGCSSRFPYYMNTYGFHGIHGRAPAIATGVKLANPDLSVWIATGDGDALSIGGNHLIHMLRRNLDIKILLFNNRIYGLTKGQYSPTSEPGKRTSSTPYGSIDLPFRPTALALGAGASFVARTIDVQPKHIQSVLERAYAHKGSCFIEIMQNCNIFNDGAFNSFLHKDVRDDRLLYVEHGKPLTFGKEKEKGIRLNGHRPEIVKTGNGVPTDDLVIWDEKEPDPTNSFILSQMSETDFPVPIGVFRAHEGTESFETSVWNQIRAVQEKEGGKRSLKDILYTGEMWEVK